MKKDNKWTIARLLIAATTVVILLLMLVSVFYIVANAQVQATAHCKYENWNMTITNESNSITVPPSADCAFTMNVPLLLVMRGLK
jgi:uncharacterized membrane protein